MGRVVVDHRRRGRAARGCRRGRLGRRVAGRAAGRARRRVAGAATRGARDDRRGGRRQAPADRAPALDAGAEAARAGVENLARTLSVEWARYGIRTAALLPGAATTPDEVAELVAFLASRAGDYYSGCALRPGVRVSERYRVTSLDSIEALPGPARCAGCRSATSSGSARSGPTLMSRRRPATMWSSRTPRRRAGTRSCTSSRAARRRSRSTATRSRRRRALTSSSPTRRYTGARWPTRRGRP